MSGVNIPGNAVNGQLATAFCPELDVASEGTSIEEREPI
jgi:hypothetical protein